MNRLYWLKVLYLFVFPYNENRLFHILTLIHSTYYGMNVFSVVENLVLRIVQANRIDSFI